MAAESVMATAFRQVVLEGGRVSTACTAQHVHVT